ncbi:MAG: phytoene desaturase family protein [Bacteroidota bacterium]|nr:phytoene desaturase family protein [Bacteroidota bacterium]
MAESKKVVIIGAGIGGITAANFLAGNGYQVDVYEKNSAPGGRCSQIIKDGHRFDLGATMLLMPGIYRSVFKSLGLELERAIPVKELDDLYRIYFDDGQVLSFTSDKARMREQLERIEPGSSLKSEKYVSAGYDIYKVSLKKLINRNFYSLFSFFSPAMVPVILKLKPITPHFRYTTRFFKHPHLLMAYTFQNIYVGQSPFNSPALFSMVPATELTEGSLFPSEGGLFSVVEKLTENAKRKGVRFHFETNVRKIVVNGKKSEGIVLGDGSEIGADIVVANADLPYVYRELLPDRKASSHLERLKYSCSAICYHWGLDKEYPQLSHHNVFLSDNFKKGLDRIFIEKSVSDTPSFYVHAPARTDPSAAPQGHETLSVIVAAGHIDRNFKQDWDRLREETRVAVVRRLEKAGLENLGEHIKFEICYTPESWERACNISRGSVFGSLGHNIFQMGYFRPHNRHDKYKNIYFVGGSTHPGNGIPNVLISARLVSERILKENKKRN